MGEFYVITSIAGGILLVVIILALFGFLGLIIAMFQGFVGLIISLYKVTVIVLITVTPLICLLPIVFWFYNVNKRKRIEQSNFVLVGEGDAKVILKNVRKKVIIGLLTLFVLT
ncbi:MAG: hypothetical protein HC773_06180 [Scytonema sp. CRU_2_7]|nr:hypothetical protein [Scytonema sp. CRU_2_7]